MGWVGRHAPRLELDLEKDLKDIWGFEISKNQGGFSDNSKYIYRLTFTHFLWQIHKIWVR